MYHLRQGGITQTSHDEIATELEKIQQKLIKRPLSEVFMLVTCVFCSSVVRLTTLLLFPSKVYKMIATGELTTIHIGRDVRVSTISYRNRLKSVDSRMVHPPEKRIRKTRMNVKNVPTHVATPAISGGKRRSMADNIRHFELAANISERQKTPRLTSRMRYSH